MSDTDVLIGGIEAGGTKFICGVGSGRDGSIVSQTEIETTTPSETIGKVIKYFAGLEKKVVSLGIACFGPIDPDTSSPTYGYITTTPKPGWTNCDIVGQLVKGITEAYKLSSPIPAVFDTDVNGSALGEQKWGAGQGLKNIFYVTIGTGIGAGVMVNGSLLHGLMHPEFGHCFVPIDKSDEGFAGVCPYHGACLEGLAAGPALEARWKQKGSTLPQDHPAWALEAKYLGAAFANAILALSPQRIILGGGVMQQPHLIEMVREAVQKKLNGYIARPELLDNEKIKQYIVLPGLGNSSGLAGAFALGLNALENKS